MLVTAAILHIISSWIIISKEKLRLNPIHLANIGFIIVFLIEASGLLHQSRLGMRRGAPQELLPETQIFLLILSVVFVGCSLKFNFSNDFRFRNRIAWRIEPSLIIYVTTILMAVDAFMMFSMIGVLPIVEVAESGVTDFAFRTPITPLTFALFRLSSIILALKLATRTKPLKKHLVENFHLYVCLAITMLLYLTGTKRNLVYTNSIILMIGLLYGWVIRARMVPWLILFVLTFSLFFIVYGNFRRKAVTSWDFAEDLSIQIENDGLRNVVAWVANYGGTSVRNFDAVIRHYDDFGYGKILISDVLPNSIMETVVRIPQKSVSFLYDKQLFPNPGRTFRTAYADFYPDFGLVGTLLFSSMVVVGCFWMCANQSKSILTFAVMLNFVPGIVFLPFLNRFLTLQHILPILAILCLTKTIRLIQPEVKPPVPRRGATIR